MKGSVPVSLSIILVSTGHSWNHRRLAEFRLMSSFSFHARYALLTYAQCGDLCPFTIVDLLSTMGAECIIGREHHQDGEFTFMCLSISDGSTEVEEQIRSMWEVSTQTLASLMALRRRVTTTHAKMGMLLREASIGPFQLRAEEEIAKLILSGVKSHRQRLENHFGIWCMTWIQNLQSLALPNYRSIVIGNTDIVPRLRITSRSSI